MLGFEVQVLDNRQVVKGGGKKLNRWYHESRDPALGLWERGYDELTMLRLRLEMLAVRVGHPEPFFSLSLSTFHEKRLGLAA